jgi:stearoyl-CoA desaturase (delta-9 desaturase)
MRGRFRIRRPFSPDSGCANGPGGVDGGREQAATTRFLSERKPNAPAADDPCDRYGRRAVNAHVQVPPPALETPWKRSWFFVAPGELQTLVWLALIHLGALAAVLLPAPPLAALIAGGVALFLGGLGTTVCYHRALAHRTLRLHPVIEHLLIFVAMFNGSGSPRQWVAMHRLHHAVSDRDDDISSPRNGFWWAHLRWLWQADQARSARYAPDLDRPAYRAWYRMQVPILALSFAGGLVCAIGCDWQTMLSALVWFGPIRLVWALHAQCTVNSICHLGPLTAEHGSGRNVGWLALVHMGQGENWHANHHRNANEARLGNGWQIDIGWWTIRALALVGLATRVKHEAPTRAG